MVLSHNIICNLPLRAHGSYFFFFFFVGRAGLSEREALARFGCHGDAEREPIRGSGGRAPAGSRGRAPGQRGSGGKAP